MSCFQSIGNIFCASQAASSVPNKEGGDADKVQINDAPSLTILDRCAITVGNEHVQAIAGGLVVYGLATWWLGGSGLLIAGIGGLIWLISTITVVALQYRDMTDSDGQPEFEDPILYRRLQPSYVSFKAMSACIGWATPAGWLVLGVLDIYRAGNQLMSCCYPQGDKDNQASRADRGSSRGGNEEQGVDVNDQALSDDE